MGLSRGVKSLFKEVIADFYGINLGIISVVDTNTEEGRNFKQILQDISNNLEGFFTIEYVDKIFNASDAELLELFPKIEPNLNRLSSAVDIYIYRVKNDILKVFNSLYNTLVDLKRSKFPETYRYLNQLKVSLKGSSAVSETDEAETNTVKHSPVTIIKPVNPAPESIKQLPKIVENSKVEEIKTNTTTVVQNIQTHINNARTRAGNISATEQQKWNTLVEKVTNIEFPKFNVEVQGGYEKSLEYLHDKGTDALNYANSLVRETGSRVNLSSASTLLGSMTDSANSAKNQVLRYGDSVYDYTRNNISKIKVPKVSVNIPQVSIPNRSIPKDGIFGDYLKAKNIETTQTINAVNRVSDKAGPVINSIINKIENLSRDTYLGATELVKDILLEAKAIKLPRINQGSNVKQTAVEVKSKSKKIEQLAKKVDSLNKSITANTKPGDPAQNSKIDTEGLRDLLEELAKADKQTSFLVESIDDQIKTEEKQVEETDQSNEKVKQKIQGTENNLENLATVIKQLENLSVTAGKVSDCIKGTANRFQISVGEAPGTINSDFLYLKNQAADLKTRILNLNSILKNKNFDGYTAEVAKQQTYIGNLKTRADALLEQLTDANYSNSATSLEDCTSGLSDLSANLDKLLTRLHQAVEKQVLEDNGYTVDGKEGSDIKKVSNIPREKWGVKFSFTKSIDIKTATRVEKKKRASTSVDENGNPVPEIEEYTPDINKEETAYNSGRKATEEQAWYMALLPAMRSTIPLQGGSDTPGALPGLNFKLNTNITKHKIIGFQPIYQHLGIDSITCTIVGFFTGADGENPDLERIMSSSIEGKSFSNAVSDIVKVDKSRVATLAKDLDSYRNFQSFTNFAVQQARELTVEINIGRNTLVGTDLSGEGGFLRDSATGNPKFKGIVRRMDIYHARQDRTWYIIDIEISDSGLVTGECVNLTTDIEKIIKEKGIDNTAIDSTSQVSTETYIECLEKDAGNLRCSSNGIDQFNADIKVEYCFYIPTGQSWVRTVSKGKGKATYSEVQLDPTQSLLLLEKRIEGNKINSLIRIRDEFFKNCINNNYFVEDESKKPQEPLQKSDIDDINQDGRSVRFGGLTGGLTGEIRIHSSGYGVYVGSLFRAPFTPPSYRLLSPNELARQIFQVNNLNISEDIITFLKFNRIKELKSDCRNNPTTIANNTSDEETRDSDEDTKPGGQNKPTSENSANKPNEKAPKFTETEAEAALNNYTTTLKSAYEKQDPGSLKPILRDPLLSEVQAYVKYSGESGKVIKYGKDHGSKQKILSVDQNNTMVVVKGQYLFHDSSDGNSEVRITRTVNLTLNYDKREDFWFITNSELVSNEELSSPPPNT